MVVDFKGGKVVVTPYEIVVRLDGEHKVSMQAQNDAVQLIGQGANVISVNSSECKWSIKLESEEQLRKISDETGCPIV